MLFDACSVENWCVFFSFSWTRDGSPLNISKLTVKVDEANGTLIILSPRAEDEGLYQCFAHAMFGTLAGLSAELCHACKSSTGGA